MTTGGALRVRRLLLALIGASLLLGMGCSLLNQAPTARIAVDVTSGASPLAVRFDGSSSTDRGVISSYAWNFGDGAVASGPLVTHTFLALAGTVRYTVSLTVTDGQGATDETTQTIEVRPGQTPDDRVLSARITTAETLGTAPFGVTFNAGTSTGVGRPITLYQWNFGDGNSATGPVVTHVFDPPYTSYFTVQLTIMDDEGRQGMASVIVTVLVPNAGADEPPHAEFAASDLKTLFDSPSPPNPPSIYEVTFNPEGCYAAPGHTVEVYVWEFGDGGAATLVDNAPFTHVYSSGAVSHTFVVSLTVVDDQGLTGSAVGNVTVRHEDVASAAPAP